MKHLRCKKCRARKNDVKYVEKYGRQLCKVCIDELGRHERQILEHQAELRRYLKKGARA